MTDRYAVIGNPISHSKSPAIHTAFARQTGQDLSYEAVLAPLEAFGEQVRRFMREGGKGMNVTVPFKIQAFEMADRLTDRARHAQAVNTLKFEDDGSILGDNTDGMGMVRDIRDALGAPITGRRVLLLGAGGAARGVLLPLLEEMPACLAIANRTPERAGQLAALCAGRGPVQVARFDGLGGEGAGAFDIVINATSASLGGEGLSLPAGVYAPGALAYDMVYGDRPTPFMQQAREQGAARVSDGLGMLVGQAAESFFLWRGVRPDTAPVIAMLRGA